MRFRRKGVIWATLGIVLAGGIVYGTSRVLEARQSAERASTSQSLMRTIPARLGTISEEVSALGTLRPATQFDVKTNQTGVVAAVQVMPGAEVKAGNVLIRLETADLELKLKQAEAGYLSAKSSYDRLIAGASETDIAQAQISMRQSEISLQSAREELATNKKLYEGGAISRQALANSENKVATAEQQWQSAKLKLAQLTASADARDVEVAKVQLAQAEANLDAAKKAINDSVIRAPIAGTVLDVPVKVGDQVNGSTVLATVADLRTMQAETYINEIDIPKIQVDQMVQMTVDALPSQRFSGKVTEISRQSQVSNNIVTYRVLADVPNVDGNLLPGMTVDVSVVVASKEDALLVPIDAITDRGGRSFVMLQAEEGEEPTPQPIETGIRSDLMAEVISGLEEGDRVAIFTAPAGGNAPNAAQMRGMFGGFGGFGGGGGGFDGGGARRGIGSQGGSSGGGR